VHKVLEGDILDARTHTRALGERHEVACQERGLLFAFEPARWLELVRLGVDLGAEKDIADGVADRGLNFERKVS